MPPFKKTTFHIQTMKLSEFSFNLPKELIAEFPNAHRDESRLMVVNRKTGKIEHKVFKDILGFFWPPGCSYIERYQSFPCPPLWP